jgi:hypothetical protein
MPASASARNYGGTYRTRAAVLCFGGWGLQTMLHLWPRLRLIQEERQVLGIDRELPNLDRLTAFAAILPETAPASGTLPVPPFHVLQPNLERYPAPFYLERQLASIEAEAAEASVSGLTHAERVGARLLKRVRDDGYVRPLPVTFRQSADDGPGEQPASRVGMFRAGIEAAGPIVRALVSQVIDPTRLDSMQTRDPFVQTTIYVIAPLSEPLASALVWPVVSELVGALKRRHVSRVIAFFSTASFASDDGRTIEEATAHMSLRELEALTGSDGKGDRRDLLSRLIADCGGAAWEERVGRKLFDVVHLIDREKSNQALAESALDLSVLTGNAVEAFLTADGLGHLERSLGPETVTGRPSYSVLGAASDHVPLAEYIASAIEEEQKGVIRSAVLAAGDRPVTVEADLQALGATPDAFVRRFLDASGTPMFKLATDRPSPAWLPGLQIAEGYLLPKADASDLRETKDPMRWRELLEFRAAGVAAEVKGAYGAAQVAWGLSPDRLDGEEPDLPSARGGDLEPRDLAVSRANVGVIPRAADLAAEQIVADMCSAPDGILAARARLLGWLGAVGALLHDLQQETGATDDDDDAYQTRLDAWQWAFTTAAESHPQAVTFWARILVVACLSLLGLAGIVLLQRSFDLDRGDRIALAVGLAGALALLGAAAWLATSGRLRRLKQQRIALAQEDLSRVATQLLRRGLCRAYSQLAGELTGLLAAVEDALVDLSDWARAEPELQQAASDAGDAPTRAALTNEELWASVRDHVRRESADGEQGLERFRELWHKDGSDSPQWLPEGNRLARRLRTALDESRPAHGDAPSVAKGAGRSMARGAGHSIARVFREVVARATEHLSPTHRLFADHPDLVQETIGQYGAEQLLLSDQRHEPAGAADHNGAEVVENLYVRAKPSAGFEVTYLLSSDVLEVEFGVGADAPTSPLRRVFEQRGMKLLTSKDPLALSLIRTVNRLGPSELILTERCRDEFTRLSQSDRAMLSLFSADESSEAASLYGERDEPATPERQVSPAAVRR